MTPLSLRNVESRRTWVLGEQLGREEDRFPSGCPSLPEAIPARHGPHILASPRRVAGENTAPGEEVGRKGEGERSREVLV